jgi:hypothetical protein
MKDFNLKDALAGKPVITRDGRPVEISSHNPLSKSGRVLIGWVDNEPYTWLINGCNTMNDTESDGDLFMAPSERKEWVVRTPVLVDMLVNGNHYSNNIFGPFDNYETAMKTADSLKGSIHEITIHE